MGTARRERRPGHAGPSRPVLAVVLPGLLVVAVLLADLLEGPGISFVGLLVAAPMLSAVFGRPRTVVLVGLATLLAAGGAGPVLGDGNAGTQVTRLAIIGLFTVAAGLSAAERVRGEARLARADLVVAAVAEAVIRPLPDRVGGVALASRYLGADAEAQVGGDFYEVLDTAHGVRVVLGDVRGKGLSAVRMANYVLGAFRDAARREASLTDVVDALDGLVSTEGGPEDFVTAVVLEVRDGTVLGVTCGHPQPWLVDDGTPREARLPVDVPLGLGAGRVAPVVLPGPPSGLLLHSDGLTEARRPGGPFLELADVLAGLPGARGDLLLAGLVDAVRAHVGGRLQDDVALLWLDVRDVVSDEATTGATTGAAAARSAAPAVRTAPAPRLPADR